MPLTKNVREAKSKKHKPQLMQIVAAYLHFTTPLPNMQVFFHTTMAAYVIFISA
jgi:hypothetical protein